MSCRQAQAKTPFVLSEVEARSRTDRETSFDFAQDERAWWSVLA